MEKMRVENASLQKLNGFNEKGLGFLVEGINKENYYSLKCELMQCLSIIFSLYSNDDILC